MSQYKIIATKYNESGAMTNITETFYADTAEHAEQIYEQYRQMQQENGMKAYKVELYVNCYKHITNAAEFFDQFKA